MEGALDRGTTCAHQSASTAGANMLCSTEPQFPQIQSTGRWPLRLLSSALQSSLSSQPAEGSRVPAPSAFSWDQSQGCVPHPARVPSVLMSTSARPAAPHSQAVLQRFCDKDRYTLTPAVHSGRGVRSLCVVPASGWLCEFCLCLGPSMTPKTLKKPIPA